MQSSFRRESILPLSCSVDAPRGKRGDPAMKRFRLWTGSIALSVAALACGPSPAAVLVDFSGHTNNQLIGNTYASIGLTFSGAIFSQCGGGCPPPNPESGWSAVGPSYLFSAFFTVPQTDISFQAVSFSSTLARAYDINNNLVASVRDDETFPLSNRVNHLTGTGITSIVFSSGISGWTPGIANLTFNGEVPEPASWAMMVMGFGLVGTLMRRRAKVRDVPSVSRSWFARAR